ncbi:MAG: prepilin-type N-terminal cleavage/methylation domain-containing protein [Actinobacteria bacterium]|nr:prepilin-type N-terminal cleavage/methylation domain-containing protein [Actinomycetota bacterium]
MKEERDGGFTLIELLVVILIIAILAAIAIPVFLRQREKGWRSQMESAVKNAATAQESYLTSEGEYANGAAGLTSLETEEGLKYANDVTLTVVGSEAQGYCVMATHANIDGEAIWYHSDGGEPTDERPASTAPACPTAPA